MRFGPFLIVALLLLVLWVCGFLMFHIASGLIHVSHRQWTDSFTAAARGYLLCGPSVYGCQDRIEFRAFMLPAGANRLPSPATAREYNQPSPRLIFSILQAANKF